MPRTVIQVVIAVDHELSPAAVDAAAALAEHLGSELVGVCIEDLNLLRGVQLPLAREVGLVSAQSRPLNTAGLQRQLELRARRARARFDALAHKCKAPRSFRVLRGLVEERTGMRRDVRPAAVWLVVDTATPLAELVDRGLALAALVDAPLHVIGLAGDSATAGELAQQVSAAIAGRAPPAGFVWHAATSANQLGDLIDRSGPVVAAANSAWIKQEDALAALLYRVAGPLVIVKA